MVKTVVLLSAVMLSLPVFADPIDSGGVPSWVDGGGDLTEGLPSINEWVRADKKFIVCGPKAKDLIAKQREVLAGPKVTQEEVENLIQSKVYRRVSKTAADIRAVQDLAGLDLTSRLRNLAKSPPEFLDPSAPFLQDALSKYPEIGTAEQIARLARRRSDLFEGHWEMKRRAPYSASSMMEFYESIAENTANDPDGRTHLLSYLTEIQLMQVRSEKPFAIDPAESLAAIERRRLFKVSFVGDKSDTAREVKAVLNDPATQVQVLSAVESNEDLSKDLGKVSLASRLLNRLAFAQDVLVYPASVNELRLLPKPVSADRLQTCLALQAGEIARRVVALGKKEAALQGPTTDSP